MAPVFRYQRSLLWIVVCLSTRALRFAPIACWDKFTSLDVAYSKLDPSSPHVRHERPFVEGDIWRGVLTSCHQLGLHLERNYRYFPVDLSIDVVESSGSEITATFVTHFDHSFYELSGSYEEDERRFFFQAKRGKLGKLWEPCDAEGYVSPDFSTLSGLSLCDDNEACDAGGGEFILRREATQFVVEGAGNDRANGIYLSKRGMELASPGIVTTASKNSDLEARLYDGAPVYVQACPKKKDDIDDDIPCDPFAIVHETVGQFGFWRIQRAATVGTKDAQVLYVILSEEVYPPDSGWRAVENRYAPPPRVRPSISSMYSDLKSYQQPANDRDSEQRFLFFSLLLTIGTLLWALVVRSSSRILCFDFFSSQVLLLRFRFRLKFLSPSRAADATSSTTLPLTSS